MSFNDKMTKKQDRATELHYKWLENGSLSPAEDKEMATLSREIDEYYDDLKRFGFRP